MRKPINEFVFKMSVMEIVRLNPWAHLIFGMDVFYTTNTFGHFPEMEKDGRSGRAKCANFSQQC